MVWSCEEKTNRGYSNASNWRLCHYGMVLEGHAMADFARRAMAATFHMVPWEEQTHSVEKCQCHLPRAYDAISNHILIIELSDVKSDGDHIVEVEVFGQSGRSSTRVRLIDHSENSIALSMTILLC
ncbi:hypothetical protein L195_g044741 [Trifolium pratense]|uniref:Uncharacterized protein n=1 Tax=Trifolium pratense TaxID=57577 RepID=A0A2K3MCX7_TRIPR|nr:hypothetical protein L195_g044741 [Trifolium pratense]